MAWHPLSSRGAHSFLLGQVVGVQDDCYSAIFLIKQAVRADLQACLVSRQRVSCLSPLLAGTPNLYQWDLSGWDGGFFFHQKEQKGLILSPRSQIWSWRLKEWGQSGRKAGMTPLKKSHGLCLVVSGIWGCSEPRVPALGLSLESPIYESVRTPLVVQGLRIHLPL